jgi:hypothetical protein
MYAAANHLMQDLMSDTLVRTVGTAGRDLYESMLNYALVRTTRRRRYRSSSYLSSPSWSSSRRRRGRRV